MLALLNMWNIAAAVLWFWFLYARQTHIEDKKQQYDLFVFVIFGTASIIVLVGLWWIAPLQRLPWREWEGLWASFTWYVVMVGLYEEAAKAAVFIFLAFGLGTLKEPQDGVLQAAAVGLAFAFVENIGYFGRYPSLWTATRVITGLGGHMMYCAIWGGMISGAKWANTKGRDLKAYRLAVLAFLFAAFMHGACSLATDGQLW